jgi:hypothetical protein
MRQELENAYNRLYDAYNDPVLFQLPFSIYSTLNDLPIRTAMDRVELEFSSGQNNNFNQASLRPDAKYFIVLIFTQMVAAPLVLENLSPVYSPEAPDISDLAAGIEKDVEFLLRLGYERKRNATDKEVTAHTILTLIDENWDKLYIAKFELWNRSR